MAKSFSALGDSQQKRSELMVEEEKERQAGFLKFQREQAELNRQHDQNPRAAMLQSLHQLQLKELKLQQKKAEVELQAEIAEIEAKRKVYEEEEASRAGRLSLRRRENEPLG